MSQVPKTDAASNKRALGGWIASGWGLFFLVAAATWWGLPADMTDGVRSTGARLAFALSHVLAASLLLFLGFLAVGATRWQAETADTTANPIHGSKAEQSVHNRVHTQFLSNTTEQFVMFGAAALAASAFVGTHYLRVITLATVLWIAGRIFFWGGYWYTASRGLPTYPRAVGLGLGLLCTLGLVGISAMGICLHFPSFSGLEGQFAQLGDSLIIPAQGMQGSNLLPVAFFGLVAFAMAILARFPRLAPPVIPMAVISCLGWGWLLVSGAIPIR